MAKKLSKFGAAFRAAKDGSVFDFNGKKYKKEYASDKKKSKLPKTTNVKPTPRPDTGSAKAVSKPSSSVSSNSGPSFRGGGPKIAKSKQNMEKNTPKSRETRKSEAYIKNNSTDKGAFGKMLSGMDGKKKETAKAKSGPSLGDMARAAARGFKKQVY